MQKCTLALGCFWRPEENFKNKPGILKTEVGYAGGQKSEVTYAKIRETNEIHIKIVEDLNINNKYVTLIFKIEYGIKTTKENTVDRHSEEKPINEIISNFFSTDCFFLILFLLMQAYSFHHVLHKL